MRARSRDFSAQLIAPEVLPGEDIQVALRFHNRSSNSSQIRIRGGQLQSAVLSSRNRMLLTISPRESSRDIKLRLGRGSSPWVSLTQKVLKTPLRLPFFKDGVDKTEWLSLKQAVEPGGLSLGERSVLNRLLSYTKSTVRELAKKALTSKNPLQALDEIFRVGANPSSEFFHSSSNTSHQFSYKFEGSFGTIEPNEIRQSSLFGSCSYLAALNSHLASGGSLWHEFNEDGTVTFRFRHPERNELTYTTVDTSLAVSQGEDILSSRTVTGETWVGVWEKALALTWEKWGYSNGWNLVGNGSMIHTALEIVTGKETGISLVRNLTPESYLQLVSKGPVVVASRYNSGEYFVPSHAQSALSSSSLSSFEFYNSWGLDQGWLDTKDGVNDGRISANWEVFSRELGTVASTI